MKHLFSSPTAHKLARVAMVAVLAMVMAACGSRNSQQETTATVVDDYGRAVVVPAQPRRVVSLSPAVTEIMFALGAQDLLVGRTDFCAYPPEAGQIASIGGISNLNIESILSHQPDLVISGSMVSKKAVDQMDRLGTPMVCVVEKPLFEGLYENIHAIGRLVGREHEADSLNRRLEGQVSQCLDEQDDPQAPTPSVYYVVGYGPTGNFTAGGNTFINDIIRMAGGRNIAEEVEGWSYSLEALMKEDPDYVIVRREDSAAFCSMSPYNNLGAVRKGHVIGIVSGTLDLQVPRNIEAILYLRQRMRE